MQQLRLQLLHPLEGALALGQIAHKAGKEPMPLSLHLADREFHREGRAVLALTRNHSPETDDPPLAGREVASDVAVMVFGIRRRHQHADITAANLLGGITEHPCGGWAEGLDDTALVDDD